MQTVGRYLKEMTAIQENAESWAEVYHEGLNEIEQNYGEQKAAEYARAVHRHDHRLGREIEELPMLTKKVQLYIDTSRVPSSFVENHPALYEKQSEGLKKLLGEMSLEELKSMEGRVDPRIWAMGIKPRIDEIQGREIEEI